jgi:LemA protein
MFKWLVPVGIVALVAMWAMSTQATLATKNQNVNRSYAQVQNVMQRQAELIPNLVETVKAYAKFEQDTFTQVAEARSKSGGVTNIDASKIANDPALQKQFADAQQSLSGSIGRLLMIQEKYPELKADKGFQDLRTELTGSFRTSITPWLCSLRMSWQACLDTLKSHTSRPMHLLSELQP